MLIEGQLRAPESRIAALPEVAISLPRSIYLESDLGLQSFKKTMGSSGAFTKHP